MYGTTNKCSEQLFLAIEEEHDKIQIIKYMGELVEQSAPKLSLFLYKNQPEITFSLDLEINLF